MKERVRNGWQKLKEASDSEHQLRKQIQELELRNIRIDDEQANKSALEKELADLQLKLSDQSKT